MADFELLDNGRPQRITLFSEVKAAHAPESSLPGDAKGPAGAQPGDAHSPVPAPPRYLALFFDDTHTESDGLRKATAAAEKLIATGIQPATALLFSRIPAR